MRGLAGPACRWPQELNSSVPSANSNQLRASMCCAFAPAGAAAPGGDDGGGGGGIPRGAQRAVGGAQGGAAAGQGPHGPGGCGAAGGWPDGWLGCRRVAGRGCRGRNCEVLPAASRGWQSCSLLAARPCRRRRCRLLPPPAGAGGGAAHLPGPRLCAPHARQRAQVDLQAAGLRVARQLRRRAPRAPRPHQHAGAAWGTLQCRSGAAERSRRVGAADFTRQQSWP